MALGLASGTITMHAQATEQVAVIREGPFSVELLYPIDCDEAKEIGVGGGKFPGTRGKAVSNVRRKLRSDHIVQLHHR